MATPDEDAAALDGLDLAIDGVLRWSAHVERFAYERAGAGLDASPHLLAAAARKLVAFADPDRAESARYVMVPREEARALLDDLNARIIRDPNAPIFPGIAALAAAMTAVARFAESGQAK